MNRRLVVAFLAGVVFALGLGISGMTDATKVLGFLTVGPAWDPSLAFVMISAIAVHALAYRLARRRSKPVLAERFAIPTRVDIDRSLVLGSMLFGIGWGLAGYCPGPAVVSVVGGQATTLAFVLAMLTGMALRSRGPFSAAARPSPLPSKG